MIKTSDIAEIKKIISAKEYHGILRRVAGAYVDEGKEIVHTFSRSIHSLPDDEIFKYLKLAGEIPNTKAFEDKTLELDFRHGSFVPDLLGKIAKTDLKEDGYLDNLYDAINDHYDSLSGFLILVFHGVYDVIKKTSDGKKLDESEETYDFLICAVCPVNWDKPGLKFDPSGKICAKQLQEVVGKVETGFIWPAFEERSGNKDKVLFYCKKPKNPQHVFVENTLDCTDRLTATEHRELFRKIINRSVQNCSSVGTEYGDRVLQRLNLAFSDIVQTEEAEFCEASVLSDEILYSLCQQRKLNEILIDRLVVEYRKLYSTAYQFTGWPKVRWLYDPKQAAVAKNNARRERLRRLMDRAATICAENGEMDLADEIFVVLEEENEYE